MFDGDIIEIEGYKRKWVVLSVTEWDLNHTDVNTTETGLHAFGGMWYGNNALSRHSYGKILPIDGTEKVVGKVTNYLLETLKEMVD